MAPSEMIGWECGACTFTNEDCSRRDCQMCMSKRPDRYAIVVGASVTVALVFCVTQQRRDGDSP